MLIAFCGIDGSGKTTQIKLLKKMLIEQGKKVFLTKQPSDWYRKDERVRKFLTGEICNEKIIKELALFSAADRLRHIQLEIQPKLDENYIVITDRYVYSAYAYFISRGLDSKWLREINKYAIIPDITFYIDINPEMAYKRIIARDGLSAKKEEKDITFLNKVSGIFKKQIWGNMTNYQIIDGNNDIISVHNEIKKVIYKEFK